MDALGISALSRSVVAARVAAGAARRWAGRQRMIGGVLLVVAGIGGAVVASQVAADDAALRAAAKSSVAAESPAVRYGRDPAAVLRGKRVFVGTCGAYCHSAHNMESGAPSLFDCEWRHGGTDDAIFKVISEGVQGTRMPAWHGALPEGDEDIWRIIAYLRASSMCGASTAPTSSASASDSSAPVAVAPSASAAGARTTAIATATAATATAATTTAVAKTGAKRSSVGGARRRRAHAP